MQKSENTLAKNGYGKILLRKRSTDLFYCLFRFFELIKFA